MANGTKAPQLNQGNGERVSRARMILGPNFPNAKVTRTANSIRPPNALLVFSMCDAGESTQEQAKIMKRKNGMCSLRVGRKGREESRRDLRTLARLSTEFLSEKRESIKREIHTIQGRG